MQEAAMEQEHLTEEPAVQTATLPDDAPPIPSEFARRSEEMQMLLMGFGTGLTIAGVFLVYLVFAYAKWLP